MISIDLIYERASRPRITHRGSDAFQEDSTRMSSDRTPLIDRKFASRVDWNLMRTFVDIVRAGGIGAAARQLNRQQPSISAALKRLEDHVGAALLYRTATGVE